MIEPIMFFGLGFLGASLIALVILPLVHARAARLTRRRLEASAPVSVAEIQADKDQLRAEFAMSTRRLEMTVDQLKSRTTGQLAELGKKTAAINTLKDEVTAKTATIVALEAREKAVQDRLHTTEEELTAKATALREAERKLGEKEGELGKLGVDFTERAVTADSQRIEIVALKTQVATLRDQVEGLQHEVKQAEGRLERERADAQNAGTALTEERGKAVGLGTRVAEFERERASRAAALEALEKRVPDLEMQLAIHERGFTDASRERDQLRADLAAAQRIEADLRAELSTIEQRYQNATETLRGEKALAESQLERARDERAKLQRELPTLQREAETSWDSERMENALLRERINEVAAEVARLTSALEGEDSPIDAILAEESAMPGVGNGMRIAASNPIAFPKGTSLADRIRALQDRAARRLSAN